ncbi:bifunctional metallophosphatase/5'-nucleotidase [Synechococcus elongatus]|nr:bifunctional metallophosphatase/5'-nucleotidase [Synechococcus elongatus]WKW06355.1 bifunctional metallophosphatase/5'-nucleotidase [Synechococcus elongatus PCC 7942 = FACHB-805]
MGMRLGRSLAIGVALGLGWMGPAAAEIYRFQILQLNDVYEITPVQGGRSGGLARVATLLKQLKAENPQTWSMLAGDYLSPSALGTAKVNGDRLAGQQMVAVLNAMGLDLATFGNHEFDISEAQLRQRLQEQKFALVTGNVLDAQGRLFPNTQTDYQFQVQATDCQKPVCPPLKVSVLGVTIDSNQAPYVRYGDPLKTLQQQIQQRQSNTDLFIGLTHLNLSQDQQLARSLPALDLILGGHEHENIQQWVGDDFTPIFKADANARTVYVHRLTYDSDRRDLQISSQLVPITPVIPEDPTTAAVVQTWLEKGFTGFRAQGFDPSAIVGRTTEPLDGLESSVRNESTALTRLIAKSYLRAVPTAELAIYNSGAIRIDDVLPSGPISQYDVIRMLPFGGAIASVEMRGELLQRVLEQGLKNRGSGGFLQTDGVQRSDRGWQIQGQPLRPDRWYRVAIADYLLTGQEKGLGFLTEQNPGLRSLQRGQDVRFAVIAQLQAQR